MSQFWTAFGGCVIGLVMIIAGIFLSFFGGVLLDSAVDNVGAAATGFDIPAQWDDIGNTNLLINLFYVVCYAMPLIGLGIMYISVTALMRYDQYEQYMYEE